MDSIYEGIGKRIDELIKKKYKNREEFAKELQISVNTINTHCQGRAIMRIDVLMDYSKKLNCSTDYILFGDGLKTEITPVDLKNALDTLILFYGDKVTCTGEMSYCAEYNETEDIVNLHFEDPYINDYLRGVFNMGQAIDILKNGTAAQKDVLKDLLNAVVNFDNLKFVNNGFGPMLAEKDGDEYDV